MKRQVRSGWVTKAMMIRRKLNAQHIAVSTRTILAIWASSDSRDSSCYAASEISNHVDIRLPSSFHWILPRMVLAVWPRDELKLCSDTRHRFAMSSVTLRFLFRASGLATQPIHRVSSNPVCTKCSRSNTLTCWARRTLTCTTRAFWSWPLRTFVNFQRCPSLTKKTRSHQVSRPRQQHPHAPAVPLQLLLNY